MMLNLVSVQHGFYFTWFVYYIAWAFQGRFVALMLRDFGLNNEQVGLVVGAGVAVGMISSPLSAAVCDFTSISHQTLMFVCCLAAAVAASMYAVPAIQATSLGLVGWLLLTRMLWAFFWLPVQPMIDTVSVHSLTKHEYGICRQWAAISWGISNSVFLGPLLDWYGYAFLVPGFVISALVLSLCLQALPGGHGDYTKIEEEADHEFEGQERATGESAQTWFRSLGTYFSLIWQILWAEEWLSISFYWTIFVMGGASTLVENLVFLFWVEELGASNTICGLSVAITVIFEIPLFYYSSNLLAAVSLPSILAIAGASYAARVVVYTAVTDPWLVLLVEPLHGVTFACIALSMVHYSKHVAPKGAETTSQSVAHFLRDLGRATWSVLGGMVMHRVGAVFLYLAAALIVTGSISLLLVMERLHPHYHSGDAAAHAEETGWPDLGRRSSDTVPSQGKEA